MAVPHGDRRRVVLTAQVESRPGRPDQQQGEYGGESMPSATNRFTRVVGVVARNRSLARLVLAYAVMIVAEFGQWLALIVYAYTRGGVDAAGVVVIVQLVPALLLSPVISAHLFRIGAGRLLGAAYGAG